MRSLLAAAPLLTTRTIVVSRATIAARHRTSSPSRLPPCVGPTQPLTRLPVLGNSRRDPRGVNSVGRVLASQAKCRGFESLTPLKHLRNFRPKQRTKQRTFCNDVAKTGVTGLCSYAAIFGKPTTAGVSTTALRPRARCSGSKWLYSSVTRVWLWPRILLSRNRSGTCCKNRLA